MRRMLLTAVPAALVAGACGTPPGGAVTDAESAAPRRNTTPDDPPGSRASATSSDQAPQLPAPPTATFDTVWNTVRETHFDPRHLDPSQGGVDWAAVRDTLRPKAAQAQTRDELRGVLDEMLASLGQSHFLVVDSAGTPSLDGPTTRPPRGAAGRDPSIRPEGPVGAEGGRSGVAATPTRERLDPGSLGAEVRVVEGRVLVVSVAPSMPAQQAGIEPGWELVAVDGETVQRAIAEASIGALESWRGSLAARAVEALLAGHVGERRTLLLRDRADTEVTRIVELTRAPGVDVPLDDLPSMRASVSSRAASPQELAEAGLAELTVGVIAFNLWMLPVLRPVHEAIDRFRNADGLVIDLRGNSGGIGYFATAIAGHLVEERVSLGTLRTREGTVEMEVQPRRITAAGALAAPYGGPVAILVDECTASTSEIFAGGLQSIGRARIFGWRTAGATLPAKTTPLPSGDILLHATAEYTLPGGTRLEGRGVLPDESVALRREDLRSGRDAVLATALRWIAAESARVTPRSASSPRPIQ